MSEWSPVEGEEGNERAIARREMFLPPHLQMQGKMRMLRDAMLAVKILGMPSKPPIPGWEAAMKWDYDRRTAKIKMERRVKFLSQDMSPEVIDKCQAAAKELHDRYVQNEISRAAKKWKSPKKAKAKFSEAEFKYAVKQRKVMEKKEWEI